MEEGASLSCQGAIIRDHFAYDQGGAIYGRDAKWINSSCDLIGNWAPQGTAVFLTDTLRAANFENHSITTSSTAVTSALYANDASVFVREVNFQSDSPGGSAVQLNGGAALVAERCVFSGWTGGAVVHSTTTSNSSLVLDDCDFSRSSATLMVSSPYVDAEIRNAFVSALTVENAAFVDGAFVLADRAMSCDSPSACGEGRCLGGTLGVLCECLEDGDCIGGGGALSVELNTHPPSVVYYPDSIEFDLLISAAAEGTTSAIWELAVETDNLTVHAFPTKGVLPPGETALVNVDVSSPQQDGGGEKDISFLLSSVGGDTSDSITVRTELYLCRASEYAVLAGNESVTCKRCADINGAEGVDCESPGSTLATLPIRPGYWRSSNDSEVIHACRHPNACTGATRVRSSSDYCLTGYTGPCE